MFHQILGFWKKNIRKEVKAFRIPIHMVNIKLFSIVMNAQYVKTNMLKAQIIYAKSLINIT